ncbi:hypothetical protein OSB04_017797 [Centaurea solstitialis]|uniref:Uncharacterized protein n=1 Tax=Centaurea solstitialis TaxID=347529 RepID=A0AA38TLM8_9ASTR|nr:hypothetical protein OSB04_017797 [Centaurea solstitialis]
MLKSLESCDRITTIQFYDNNFSFSGELPAKTAWNLSRLEISDKFSSRIRAGISSWVKRKRRSLNNKTFKHEIDEDEILLQDRYGYGD